MSVLVVVLMLSAMPLTSQARPRLPVDADSNDWMAYYQEGLRKIDSRPREALHYFEYAARLDPSVAEPLLGRYAAWWRSHPKLQNRLWSAKPTKQSETDSAIAVERWRAEADVRNPFAPQGVLTWIAPRRIRVSPFNPFERGLAAFFNGQWDQSVWEFTGLLLRDTTALIEYRFRALALAQLGRWSDAADDIDTLLSRIARLESTIPVSWDLGKSRLHYTAALMSMFAGQRQRARENFEQAFQIDLGFPIAHVYYGNLLLDEGDTTAGLREYAMAADLRPDDAFIRQNYGAVLFNLGRYDSALTHLTEAVRLAPDYAILYFNRGICLEQLGRPEEARAMHREFVARAPRRLKQLIQQSHGYLNRQP